MIFEENWDTPTVNEQYNPDRTILILPMHAPQVAPQVTPQVEGGVVDRILEFCKAPRTMQEMLDYVGMHDRKNFRKLYVKELIEQGKLEMTIPDKPNSSKQKYVTKKISN